MRVAGTDPNICAALPPDAQLFNCILAYLGGSRKPCDPRMKAETRSSALLHTLEGGGQGGARFPGADPADGQVALHAAALVQHAGVDGGACGRGDGSAAHQPSPQKRVLILI